MKKTLIHNDSLLYSCENKKRASCFRKGQTFVEYTLLIGVSIGILVALTPMIKRGSQAMVKVVADELGAQRNSEEQDTSNGGLLESSVSTSFAREQRKQEWNPPMNPGTHSMQTAYNEQTTTDTLSDSSLGVSPKD